jgi:cyclopropane fatty-acyl-phospholipid synthase-like methyltransferase
METEHEQLTEAEKQLLIVVGWLRSRYGLMMGLDAESLADRKNLEAFGRFWLGRYLADWSQAYPSLLVAGYLTEAAGAYALTEKGAAARKVIEAEHPFYLYEYDNFFARAARSGAHALFCERVYGRNLCQHGLADVWQLGKLLDVLKLSADDRVLDLGCGNGLVTEYLHDQTGAFFEGIDISAEAIKQARARAQAERARLVFNVGNMNRLALPRQTFSAIVSIDTLYYVDSLAETLKRMIELLRPGGQMGIFFTQWIIDLEEAARLSPDETDLARLLKQHDLKFTTLDLTGHEAEHWRKKLFVLEQLKSEFEREGNLALYEYRHSEAARYAHWDLRKRSRHLYHVQT